MGWRLQEGSAGPWRSARKRLLLLGTEDSLRAKPRGCWVLAFCPAVCPASLPVRAARWARDSSAVLVPPRGVAQWQVYNKSDPPGLAPGVLGVTFQPL